MFEILRELDRDGTLKAFVNGGFISTKVYMYMEIYMWIDAKMKTTGKNISTIVTDAEIAFNVSRQTVWTVIKVMKSENKAPEIVALSNHI